MSVILFCRLKIKKKSNIRREDNRQIEKRKRAKRETRFSNGDTLFSLGRFSDSSVNAFQAESITSISWMHA